MAETGQWQSLKVHLKYAAENSPYYKRLFQDLGIDPLNIHTEADFRQIPVTTKEQLQEFNQDFVSVPSDKLIDHVTTSGTLGKPVSIALTDSDLDRLALNEYHSFRMAGITAGDKVQITTTLDRRFMAGMAYFLGLRKLGAGIIRTGSGLPILQWESIARFQPTHLVAVPSFLLKMLEFAIANKIDYRSSSIKAAICIGEPLRDAEGNLNALGRKISSLWDIELYSTYASTEMATAFTECQFHSGHHIQQDLIYTEILDENLEPVAQGEYGELVVTPLGTEGMPLIRYATGDVVKYLEAECECGRTGGKISSITGRKRHKMKIKGVSIYPQHVMDILNTSQFLKTYFIQVSLDEFGGDRLSVSVSDRLHESEIQNLKEALTSGLQATPVIIQLPEREIERLRFPKNSRKPILFQDLRPSGR